jgi:serine protease AprX
MEETMKTNVQLRKAMILGMAVLFLAVIGAAALTQGNEQNTAEGLQIRLKADTFDPLKEQPDIPDHLRLTQPNNYYLIQCTGPIQPGWVNRLQDMGVVIEGYIPDYAYIANMDEETRFEVEQLPFIRWTGLFHPAYKFDSRMEKKDGDIVLNVLVFKGKGGSENLYAARDAIIALGGEIRYEGRWDIGEYLLEVKIDASKIADIARIPEVMWFDEWSPPVPCMDNVRQYIGADTAHLAYGFDGTGIIGGVKDNGLELDHPDFAGQIIGTEGSFSDEAHGTCSFGIIFSSGDNGAQAKGMLPGGGGVFIHWALERWESCWIVEQSYGGVFLSNGWRLGSPDAQYSVYSCEDDACVQFFDIVLSYAAGNYGANGSQSVSHDAVAKNVIGVGGVTHFNNASCGDDQWGGHGVIPAASYGPAADGRIKPDLCGPDDDVYTTDSQDGDGNDGYRIGDYVYTDSDGMFGNTSAATAVVSGCVGIVYQMYQEDYFGNNPGGDRPHASTVKAILIVDAYQYEFSQAIRFQQGWGTPDLQNTIDIAEGHFIVDEEIVLHTGEGVVYAFTPDTAFPMKISLVWTDPPGEPGANKALINDLNLKVTAPNATEYWGNYGLDTSHWSVNGGVADSLNNVENVFIENPIPGEWTIEVIAENVAMDGHPETPELDQDFALVATVINPTCCNGDGIRGDVDGSASINVGDPTYLTDYLFFGGDPPPCQDPDGTYPEGDADASGSINVGDPTYLTDYLFFGGPQPLPCP